MDMDDREGLIEKGNEQSIVYDVTHNQSYEIQAEIGRGGLGIIYRAFTKQSLLPVLLKEIFPAGIVAWREKGNIIVSDDDKQEFELAKERLIEEAVNGQRIALITGYAIPIHHCFSYNGTYYGVMDDGSLHGMTLKELLTEMEENESFYLYEIWHKNRVSFAIYLIRQILRPLKTMHFAESPIVHLDLQPGNLFFCGVRENIGNIEKNVYSDSFLNLQIGECKVLDFGMSHIASGEEKSVSIQRNQIYTTMGYRSPQLAFIYEENCFGPWDDTYSITAILYQMLFGETAWKAHGTEFGISRGEGDYLLEIEDENLNAEAKDKLKKILKKGFSYSPKMRYQNAREMDNVLEEYQYNELGQECKIEERIGGIIREILPSALSQIQQQEKKQTMIYEPICEEEQEEDSCLTWHQKEYIDFSCDVVKILYGEKEYPLLKYFGQEFPDVVIEADDSVRPFDVESQELLIQKNCYLNMKYKSQVTEEQLIQLQEQYKEKNSIIYKNEYGYMNEAIQVKDGKVQGFRLYADKGTKSIFTSSILREELENSYKRMNNMGMSAYDKSLILQMNPWRNIIWRENGKGMVNLFQGKMRYSQLGLQVVVLFQNNDKYERLYREYSGRYWTPVIIRSNQVSEQQGFYQFVPCGSFFIPEPEKAAKRELTQKRYMDLFTALMRLYCNGLFYDCKDSFKKTQFGASPFDRAISGRDSMNILYDNVHYQEFINMLDKKEAELEFLGISSSLVTLKSDLVFMMVIRDKYFYVRNKRNFKSGYRSESLFILPIELFFKEEFIEEKCLCQELSGPLELMKRSKTFQKLIEEND